MSGMNILQKMNHNILVANLLDEISQKLRVGACTMSSDEALELVSNIAHINLSKQEVADRYNVSTKTIERKEKDGLIPQSHHKPSSKKNWYLDELILFENENYN